MTDQKNQVFTQEDIDKNKTYAALAYLIFFIPLLAAKDSAFGKFHANQGLVLLIVAIISQLLYIIPIIGWIAAPILGIAVFVFAIMGIINAINGNAKELPLIGGINLINK